MTKENTTPPQEQEDATEAGIASSALLSCPFCRGEAFVDCSPVNGDYDKPDRWQGEARCADCEANVRTGGIMHVCNSYEKAPNRAKTMAAKKWNHRG